MQRIIVLLICLAVASACEREEIQPVKANQSEETPTATLVGKWEWVRSDGGFAAHIHDTPKTTGQHIVLEFKKDNQYLEYINGVLKAQGTYALSTRKCIHTREEKPVISISNSLDLMIERMDKNSLELSDECADGIQSQYKRK